MRSRYRILEGEGVYFLTMTIVEWIPALIGEDACAMILDSLQFCRAHKGLKVYGYVIMDNHIHLVADAPELSAVVQSFQRHTAGEIIREAEAKRRTWLLNQFEYYKRQGKTTSRHQVWQEGAHPQWIQGDAMLVQKLEYIHNNPVRRGYVDLPEHWRYSSARNYAGEGRAAFEIDPLPE